MQKDLDNFDKKISIIFYDLSRIFSTYRGFLHLSKTGLIENMTCRERESDKLFEKVKIFENIYSRKIVHFENVFSIYSTYRKFLLQEIPTIFRPPFFPVSNEFSDVVSTIFDHGFTVGTKKS